jgi:hypothetical protein
MKLTRNQADMHVFQRQPPQFSHVTIRPPFAHLQSPCYAANSHAFAASAIPHARFAFGK